VQRRAVATTVGVVVLALLALAGLYHLHERRTGDTAVTPAGPAYPVGISVGDDLRTLDREGLGKALDAVVRGGAGWIRVDVQWTHVQPDSADGFSWRSTDRIVEAARSRGLSVLALLTYTPGWARAPGCDSFTCPPAAADAFAAFAGAAAERYRDRVAAWEIWNEPNSAKFWDRPDARDYATLLRAATAAIHHAAPAGKVVLGGLTALDDRKRAVPAPRFLAEVCRAGGCDGLAAVGFHPYTYPRLATDTTAPVTAWTAMTRRSVLGPALREVLTTTGHPGLPIWVTEYGAPGADRGSGCPCVDEQQQATIIASGVSAASQDPGVVGAVFLYGLVDVGTGPSVEDHFGLLRADGSPKPAYAALQRAASEIGRAP
jgi:hypothetical protein